MLRKIVVATCAITATYFIAPLVGAVAWDQLIKPRIKGQIDPERATWRA